MSVDVSIKKLLEAGVHFGHQTQRWNPKMKPFIFGDRNGIHIVNLELTAKYLQTALDFLTQTAANGGNILFVGTKKQAQDAVETASAACEMPFVNHRWLGGMLTNFETIRKSIRKIESIDKMEAEGDFQYMTKKEVLTLKKGREKMTKNLSGIREMRKTPQVLFVVDIINEKTAIHEAKKLGIPVVGLVDTNCDPDLVDYIIPGNDDSIKGITLICNWAAEAIQSGRGQHKKAAAEEEAVAEPVAPEASAEPASGEAAAAEQAAEQPAEEVTK